jgi:hypothetical protein
VIDAIEATTFIVWTHHWPYLLKVCDISTLEAKDMKKKICKRLIDRTGEWYCGGCATAVYQAVKAGPSGKASKTEDKSRKRERLNQESRTEDSLPVATLAKTKDALQPRETARVKRRIMIDDATSKSSVAASITLVTKENKDQRIRLLLSNADLPRPKLFFGNKLDSIEASTKRCIPDESDRDLFNSSKSTAEVHILFCACCHANHDCDF